MEQEVVSLKVAVYKKAAEHVIRCIDEVHRCIDEVHCCKNEVNHWTDQMNNHNGSAIWEENSKENTENCQQHFIEHSWAVKECLKEAKKLLNLTNERLKEERQSLKEANQRLDKADVTSKQSRIQDRTQSIQRQLGTYLQIADNIDLNMANNRIEVPKLILGTDFQNGLFIREEYKTVAEIIKRNLKNAQYRRVLVIGSPGIGKSTFGVLLFLLALKERKNVAYKFRDSNWFYFFTWNSMEYNVTDCPFQGFQYEAYLDQQAGNDLFVHECISVAYLFASPCTSNYNNFKKDHCLTVYMNPWTREECMTLANFLTRNAKQESMELSIHQYINEECLRRFNLIGGKPRYIFSSECYDSLASKVKKHIPWTTYELKNQIHNINDNANQDTTEHILYSIFRNEEITSDSFVIFSSLVVKTLMMIRFNIQTANDLQMLLQMPASTLQSWNGKMLEHILLQDLATRSFCMRSLENDGVVWRLGPLYASSTIIESHLDITNTLSLYIPLSQSFPAIDALLVIPENKLILYIQATISILHFIKYQYLESVYKHLSTCQEFLSYEHIFLFLVPRGVYDEFEMQSYLNNNRKVRFPKIGVQLTHFIGKIDKEQRKHWHSIQN